MEKERERFREFDGIASVQVRIIAKLPGDHKLRKGAGVSWERAEVENPDVFVDSPFLPLREKGFFRIMRFRENAIESNRMNGFFPAGKDH